MLGGTRTSSRLRVLIPTTEVRLLRILANAPWIMRFFQSCQGEQTQYSAEYSRGTLWKISGLSLHAILPPVAFCSVNSRCLGVSALSLQLRETNRFCLGPLSLHCDHCPSLPDIQSLKKFCFIYFVWFLSFNCSQRNSKSSPCYSTSTRSR